MRYFVHPILIISISPETIDDSAKNEKYRAVEETALVKSRT